MFLVGPEVFSFVVKGVKVIFWGVQRRKRIIKRNGAKTISLKGIFFSQYFQFDQKAWFFFIFNEGIGRMNKIEY